MSIRFYRTKQEIQNMSETEFFQYMEDFNRYTEANRDKLYGDNIPQFSSVDEIKEYFHGITLEEYEQKLSDV